MFGRSGEYANVYGSISGRYNQLFSKKKFEDFLSAKSIEEILVTLEGTEYENEFKKIFGKKLKIKEIEHALKEHYSRVFSYIEKKVPEEDKETLELVFIKETEVKDLIQILRRINSKSIEDESVLESRENGIFSMLPDELVKNLMNSKNIEEALPYLEKTKKEYYKIILDKLDEYNQEKDILILENSLLNNLAKKWDYERVHAKVSKGLSDFIGMKIDVQLLKILIRAKILKNEDFRNYKVFDGFYFKVNDFERIKKTEPLSDVLKIVENTPYFELVKKSIFSQSGGDEDESAKNSLVPLEVGLDKLINDIIKEKSIIEPLSIYSVINFLAEKEREVKDLRTIFVGTIYCLSPEDLKGICQIFS